MKKKYSLLLVSPGHEYSNMWALKELGGLLNKRAATFPLALPLLASLTPDHYDITLIDEESSSINFKKKYDLVGISSIVTNMKRAYELADKFRSLGIPVVMGGPYTSLNYEKSLNHADCVVVGEAEELWPELLKDFERGVMRKMYKCETPPAFKTQPIPRWDLIDTRKSLSLNVQISRGCPNGCNFCCVPAMFGVRQRYRDIDNVIEEIKAIPSKQLSFVDDNFTANKAYAKELLARLKPLNLDWNCLCSYEIAYEPELLKDMAEAGCHTMLIGFESLNPESLNIAKKKKKSVALYKEVIDNINKAGIHVTGAFIVGFDEDNLDAFDHIYNFYKENDISYVMLNILTAFPNTTLHKNLVKQDRMIDIPVEFLTGVFPSFKYSKIDPVEMFEKNLETYEKIYSYDIIYDKLIRLFSAGNYVYSRNGISIWDRVMGMKNVFKRFVFTKNKKKRELIFKIFKLIGTGQINADVVFEYLFFIEAANDYIIKYKSNKDVLLEKIKTFAYTSKSST